MGSTGTVIYCEREGHALESERERKKEQRKKEDTSYMNDTVKL